MTDPEFSIVVPIYNEQEGLEELYRRLRALMERLDGPSEVVLINDGSSDDSYRLMLDIHLRDGRFKTINLSRNFGHQLAITAGMDLAAGSAIIIMDADLQDPPEVVLEMVARWREGFDLVYAVRRERAGETWLKRVTAWAFYRFLNSMTSIQIPRDVGDFRLVDRKALRAFNELRENNRLVRGMFAWVGFKQTAVYYSREARHAGKTHYSLRRMIKFAMDGIVSFSNAPLQLALTLGVVCLGLGLGGGAAVAVMAGRGVTVPWWIALLSGLSFFGGIQLLVLGLMGEYIARIYEEVRHRPLYVVSEVRGIERLPRAIERAVLPEARRWHQEVPITMGGLTGRAPLAGPLAAAEGAAGEESVQSGT